MYRKGKSKNTDVDFGLKCALGGNRTLIPSSED